MHPALTVVMIGATGEVGGHVVANLIARQDLQRLTLLGRRPRPGALSEVVQQHTVDVHDAATYERLLPGHRTAIATLGVGQPSKVSREEFARVDKLAVLAFATACKAAGVAHFQLLGSVGSDAQSRSFYLRTKGELEEGLHALGFDRLSIFHPSMILTPVNRYDWMQGVVLRVWPLLQFALAGPLRKYRGIRSETLGRAMAVNAITQDTGREDLFWDDFEALAKAPS